MKSEPPSAPTNAATAPPGRFTELSAARQALVRLCQLIDYGHIRNVFVRDGEPVLADAEAIISTDIRLDQSKLVRSELELNDFELTSEVLRLAALLDEIGDGEIAQIEVRAGLPRRVVTTRSVTQCMLVLNESVG